MNRPTRGVGGLAGCRCWFPNDEGCRAAVADAGRVVVASSPRRLVGRGSDVVERKNDHPQRDRLPRPHLDRPGASLGARDRAAGPLDGGRSRRGGGVGGAREVGEVAGGRDGGDSTACFA